MTPWNPAPTRKRLPWLKGHKDLETWSDWQGTCAPFSMSCVAGQVCPSPWGAALSPSSCILTPPTIIAHVSGHVLGSTETCGQHTPSPPLPQDGVDGAFLVLFPSRPTHFLGCPTEAQNEGHEGCPPTFSCATLSWASFSRALQDMSVPWMHPCRSSCLVSG